MSETPQFPMAPAPFDGNSREVDAGACFDWLAQGWAMFLAHPGIWLGSSVLLLVMLMAISIPPVFGLIAAHLLVPLFGAGMLQICRTIANDGEPQIGELFAGFRQQAGQLVMVGVFFALGVFGIALIAVVLIGGGFLGGAVSGRIGGFGIAFGGVMLAGLLVLVLSVPVIMATWFAPALVYFHGMQPLAAMKASFAAGLRNWLAMIIFGIFLVVAGFFALLPVGLGLLLLLPIFSAAVYASYRDIFPGA
ncbi:putative membrane protein [Azonexus fungiphilus]|jgi:uncharacterized membrane protein|uniref:Putative membrane protein n=1 Tax=Azonexus fungiphilus TaxID=146940 RepID=A0A495WA44_9RHOO|nr:BPSS1780 family membrane protein [Azonexus fungiphilus]NHC06521.1 hypothetical protein [Azonexus fungiphilus]RKT58586.1 putative membrane protein [Azonexus fungiphilus]